MTDYFLESCHEKLLLLTCEALDTAADAREQLAQQCLTIRTGDGGQKANPLVAIQRDARTAAMRGLRELDLDTSETPAEARRPPALRSNRRGF